MLDQNPYHPLAPPDDPTLFYGRQDAIAFLRQHTVGAHNQEFIVLSGRIGMGKTSLVRQSAYIVDERYQTVYIDTAAAAIQNTASFIIFMAESITARMEAIGASTYRVPAIPEPNLDDADLRVWFANDFLEVVLTAIRRDRFLLLLLDDLHLIFQAMDEERLTGECIDYLGDLLRQHERLDIIAAVDVAYEERALSYAPTANVTFYYRLQPFDEAVARQLITEPVESRYQYTEDAVAQILTLCGGYPFLLHSVCRLLHRQHEQNPNLKVITAEHIDAIYAAALDESGEVMRDFWNNAAPNVRLTIDALLEFYRQDPAAVVPLESLKAPVKRYLNQTQLVSALRKLEYDALIKTTEEGHYYFSTRLEPDWLLTNQPEALSRNGQNNRLAQLVGVLAVVLAVIVVGGLVALGVFDGDSEAEPGSNVPPTATFDLDINATRRAGEIQATQRAVPTFTHTPSPTSTMTDTPTPTDTFTPSATFTATHTNTATSTATDTPTRTPTPTRTDTASPPPSRTSR